MVSLCEQTQKDMGGHETEVLEQEFRFGFNAISPSGKGLIEK
jgi:hypothetical protein